MMMPVSVAIPKQAMKPTQTATLKSIGRATNVQARPNANHREHSVPSAIRLAVMTQLLLTNSDVFWLGRPYLSSDGVAAAPGTGIQPVPGVFFRAAPNRFRKMPGGRC